MFSVALFILNFFIKREERAVDIIGELPIELSIKIFKYLPSVNNVSLVNHQFHNIACLASKRFCLIDSKFIEKKNLPELLLSMENTSRKIKDVRCLFDSEINTEPSLHATILTVKNFSDTIRSLYLLQLTMEMSDFLQILSLVPKVKKIFLRNLTLRADKSSSPITPKEDEQLNLFHLKKLKIGCCDREILATFSRLPPGVLNSLTFDTDNLDESKLLLKRQANIKHLFVGNSNGESVAVPGEFLDHLDLQSLCLDKIVNDVTVLSKQTNLLSLWMLQDIEESLMNVVANRLSKLSMLEIDVASTPVEAFVNIQKLENLRSLYMKKSDLLIVEEFARLDNSRLTRIQIVINFDLTDDLIKALARSLPNLIILNIFYSTLYGRFNAIRRHFNFVQRMEILPISIEDDDDDDDDIVQSDFFNPKLTFFGFAGIGSFEIYLEEFNVAYPNLTILKISSFGRRDLTASTLTTILETFPKLEKLYLDFKLSIFNIKDLVRCFKCKKSNLKFVSLKKLDIEITTETDRTLAALLGCVNMDGNELKLAVNKKTMFSERKCILD